MIKPLQKEKVVIILSGGNVTAVYSSIPDKTLEVEIIETDSRQGRERTREYIDELVESGEAPYILF
jgi:hypothetical protein